MALTQLFARKYTEAVEVLTSILAKDQLLRANRVKFLCYRMAANLMLQNAGCFKQDLGLVTELGGYPDYFFNTLASKLSENDKKMLEQRHNLEEEWKIEHAAAKQDQAK